MPWRLQIVRQRHFSRNFISPKNRLASFLLFFNKSTNPMRNYYFLLINTIVGFVFSLTAAKAQLNASFSAVTVQGCSPLVVQFTDQSTGNPTQWKWDLGNGVISTLQNPGAIYINPGTYTIKLTIKNGSAADSLTRTDYITVHSKPQVDFTAFPTEGCAPLAVKFTDKSIAGSGTLNSWLWDFGDGINSNTQNPSHTYIISDSFNITLSVTNSFGCKQVVQKNSFIKVSKGVTAVFDYNYTNACGPPALVNFNNQSSGTPPITYQWFFGDGVGSNQINPSHTYLTSGNFEIELIARTEKGCNDTARKSLSIGNLSADFSFSGNACINDPIFFKDSSSPNPLQVSWDFGDGSIETGAKVNHRYITAGTYQVTMTADFGGCSSTTKKNVKITDKPKARFTALGNITTCQLPLTVQFNNTTTGATDYIWLFGDSTSSEAINPLHIYTMAGSFTVTLIAVNKNGCTDTLINTGFINTGPPQIIGFKNLPTSGCIPLLVNFEADIITSEPVTGFQWSFGDGVFSSSPTPSHTYNNTGAYTVSLIVSTAGGCSDTFSMPEAVLTGTPPKANFSAFPPDACASDSIAFTDLSGGIITDWLWDFGDGVTSTLPNPLHVYVDTGFFDITLRVGNNGCFDSITLDNYVYVRPPVAKFIFEKSCSDRFNIKFIDNSIGPETWSWSFGDGYFDTIQNPIHRYAAPGKYFPELIVTNGACSYSKSDTVNIVAEHPAFDFVPLRTNFCKYDSVQFFVTNYNPSNISSFNWDFGDSTSSGFSPLFDTIVHQYTATGSYTPILYTEDINGCIDTVIDKSLALNIYGPVAAFSNITGACLNSDIIFNDETYSDGNHPIITWIWNYGDGKNDTLSSGPFSHTYAAQGFYTVSLTVFDNNGCRDSVRRKNAITISSPKANFGVEEPLLCSNAPAQFIDSSFAKSPEYLWDFGDGITSTNPEPLHQYAFEGVFTVSLKIIDIYGCADSIIQPAFISISNPIASFLLNDTLFACPPSSVKPLNNSQNYFSVLWDFGDGNTSIENDPDHIYLQAGPYDIKLIAKGKSSCADTVSKKIFLTGPQASLSYGPLVGCLPLQFALKTQSKSAVKYIWDLGNGATFTNTDTILNYTYTGPGIFIPKLIVVDSSGCSVTIVNNDTVKVYGVIPAFGFTQGLNNCDSLTVNFFDSSAALFDTIVSRKWNFGDNSYSTEINPVHTYTQSGLYSIGLDITTNQGCRDTSNKIVDVVINPSPEITAIIPDLSCVFTSLNFSASNIENPRGIIEWTWLFGTGDSSANQSATYIYRMPGIYNVNVRGVNQFGCADTSEKSIQINPVPVIDAGRDSTLCLGQSVLLLPSGGDNYTWNNDISLSCLNCANPVATPDSTRKYFVSGSNIFGCSSTDSLLLLVNRPFKISAKGDDSVCIGNTIQLSVSGAQQYVWSPAVLVSDPFIPNPKTTPVSNTEYTVVGTDNIGCFTDTADLKVEVFPLPTVNILDSVVTIQVGSAFAIKTINSADVIKWSWQPPQGLSCLGCNAPIASPRNNTAYTLKVHTAAGCEAEDIIYIKVVCNDNSLFIPNTFSPNGDGMNDYFYARGKGLFNVKSMHIFNRWGQMIFEKINLQPNDGANGWDGRYKGVLVESGVYVYIMEIVCDNGNVLPVKGNVTVIR